jgi:hypothetical protein
MEQGYNRKNDTSEQSKCLPIHGSYSKGFSTAPLTRNRDQE